MVVVMKFSDDIERDVGDERKKKTKTWPVFLKNEMKTGLNSSKVPEQDSEDR